MRPLRNFLILFLFAAGFVMSCGSGPDNGIAGNGIAGEGSLAGGGSSTGDGSYPGDGSYSGGSYSGGWDLAGADLSDHHTHVYGTITVDPELDDSRDYSNIGVIILDYTAGPDTLFQAVTNRDGRFDGEARFPGQGLYSLEFYRSDRFITDTTLVLAHQDTVRIDGELPRFAGRANISSYENDAMLTLNRIDRQYNRVVRIAAAGGVSQDTIPQILDNWSEIYWQVYESWKGTLAAGIAARESLRMLEDRADEKLLRRIREHGQDEQIRRLAAGIGFMARIRLDGLDAGIKWLDSLETQSTHHDTRRQIAMNRIEVLYDSSRTDEARRHIDQFESSNGIDENTREWLESLRYDIDNLSRGQELPSFREEFVTLADDGTSRTITLEDLAGAPVVIEVVRLSDRAYQANYHQLRNIHMIYSEEGVRFLTFPAEVNPIAVRAFYNERGQDWPVAKAGAYAESILNKDWNVFEKPVRFIIDSEGRIIRKIYGHNLNELLIELNKLLMNGEQI